MNNYVHYYVSKKNPHHGHALIEGFKARRIPVENERLEKEGTHIVTGLQFGALRLMQELIKGDKPYIFVDRAYFGGGPGTNRLRVVPNAFQHHWMPEDDIEQRYEHLTIKPWQKGGDHIMVVPPGETLQQLFGVNLWLHSTLAKLHEITDRPIFVSVKGDPVPLQDRLKKCHAVVTFSSNVAVDAIYNGVPAFVNKISAAKPVAGDIEKLDEYSIETPVRVSDKERQRWVNWLSWGQFSVDEIRIGLAKKTITRPSWDLATT